MPAIEDRLAFLGLVLPAEAGGGDMARPFGWVNVRGSRAFVSGHGPREADGSLALPTGQVGGDVSPEQGVVLARKVGLTMLGSLQRALGDLDRIAGWCRVFGMVNSAPGFSRQTEIINGFSDLILDVFGPEIGRHARSAVGVAGLPLDFAVEIEAEIVIRD